MNILFSSHLFPPSIGGLQSVSQILAGEFHSAGHDVTVLTATQAESLDTFSFPIIRRPSVRVMANRSKWADVVFHNNVSLQTAWPMMFHRRPWVVAHHTWIERSKGKLGIRDRIKLRAIRHATNIAVSDALGATLGVDAVVIGNPYDDSIFRMTTPFAKKGGDLVFAGRLVSEKGADLLPPTLDLLRKNFGLEPLLTIIGDGPDREKIEADVRRRGLDSQIRFTGALRGNALAEEINHHQISLSPSPWRESFGLFALESIACGCVPLVANIGGLPSAVGKCGAFFDVNSEHSFTVAIARLLRSPKVMEEYRAHAPEHLARHRPHSVAHRYLEVIEAAVCR